MFLDVPAYFHIDFGQSAIVLLSSSLGSRSLRTVRAAMEASMFIAYLWFKLWKTRYCDAL